MYKYMRINDEEAHPLLYIYHLSTDSMTYLSVCNYLSAFTYLHTTTTKSSVILYIIFYATFILFYSVYSTKLVPQFSCEFVL